MVSPRPGPHKKFESIPLQIILRDILKIVETGKEARAILQAGEIFVDQKPRKDYAYPVGIFDVISIPKLKKNYRVLPTKNGLELFEISEKESGMKVCMIKNKTILKKGKIQLNLHDGKNILVEKDDYKTGDSILLELPSLKIVEKIPLEKNSFGIVTKGANSGMTGKVKEIISGKFRSPEKVILKSDDSEEEVLRERFFVLGKDKPAIKVGE